MAAVGERDSCTGPGDRCVPLALALALLGDPLPGWLMGCLVGDPTGDCSDGTCRECPW